VLAEGRVVVGNGCNRTVVVLDHLQDYLGILQGGQWHEVSR